MSEAIANFFATRSKTHRRIIRVELCIYAAACIGMYVFIILATGSFVQAHVFATWPAFAGLLHVGCAEMAWYIEMRLMLQRLNRHQGAS